MELKEKKRVVFINHFSKRTEGKKKSKLVNRVSKRRNLQISSDESNLRKPQRGIPSEFIPSVYYFYFVSKQTHKKLLGTRSLQVPIIQQDGGLFGAERAAYKYCVGTALGQKIKLNIFTAQDSDEDEDDMKR